MTTEGVLNLIEQIKKGEGEVLHLVNSMPFLMWTANPDGALDFINTEFYNYTEVRENSALSWSWVNFIHPDDVAGCLESWGKALSSGNQYQTEMRIKRESTGSYIWHLVRANPLKNDAGEIVKWLGTSVDINSQKTIEQTLNTFFHIVSHDLISPVNNLKGLLELLNHSEDDERPQYMKGLEDSVGRLSNTIYGLTSMIKIQHLKADASKLRFNQILESVEQDLVERINGIDLSIQTDFSRCESIIYPHYYLVSIMKNLLTNSIKYRMLNRKLVVELVTEELDSFTLIKYKDNASGIDMSMNKEKIFKPFQRFSNESEGTGLGLYMIKQIIEKNGGHIDVKSEVGVGTTFFIYLKEYSAY